MSQSRTMSVRTRPAAAADLDAINRVVERAVMTWRLPDRVKRLSLPTYRYHSQDFEHMSLLVAVSPELGVTGVAALETADPRDLPAERTGLLLHGLFVEPDHQRRGIGSRLVNAALELVRAKGLDGLLVKAQPDAVEFFHAQGMRHLPVRDHERDYPHRFWMDAADSLPSDRL
jgi:GNAT superfamily N-acetyltransferase